MDVGAVPKGAVPSSTAVIPVATSATGPLNPGTQLSAAQVVVASGEPAKLDGGPPQRSLDDVTERRVTIDEDTRELVMQSVDARTNVVMSQAPDKAILGLRAYFDRLVENTAIKAGAPGTGVAATIKLQA
jgi:hypothetical protein